MAKAPAVYPNITRHDKRLRKGRGITSGWQVRVMYRGVEHSRFFSDSLYGSPEAALDNAQVFRDQLYKQFGRVLAANAATLSDQLPRSNTSGILGVNRSSTTERSGTVREYWQTTYPDAEGGVKTKSFGISRLGEIEALSGAVEARMEGVAHLLSAERYRGSWEIIKRQIDHYLNLLVYLEGLSADDRQTLIRIVNDKKSKATEKETIIAQRIGQSAYKEKLVKLWKGQCSVTGARLLLNASHIKPWAVSTDVERLDPFNGLLLSPAYDRAFDAGYISFRDDGNIMISPFFNDEARKIGIDADARLASVTPFTAYYLTYHRSSIFISEAASMSEELSSRGHR